MKKNSAKLEFLRELVKTRLESAPGCHDWAHTLRVLNNARVIMREIRGSLTASIQPFDMMMVECAAILHDAARPEELAANGKVCHAYLGAELAPKLLRQAGFDDNPFAVKVAECVRSHRYRGDVADAPRRLEEKIIFDADKLDSIGAVGVARAFHFSGRIGSKLHNSREEALASKAYSTGDSAYREYLVKLRHIPSRMLTEPGKKLALERAHFTMVFFDRLNQECADLN